MRGLHVPFGLKKTPTKCGGSIWAGTLLTGVRSFFFENLSSCLPFHTERSVKEWIPHDRYRINHFDYSSPR